MRYKGKAHTGRVAWLEGKRIDEEMEEHDVSLSAARVGARGGRPAMGGNKASIDVVEHIGPNFSDV